MRSKKDREGAVKYRQLVSEFNKLQSADDRYELRVANALWGEKAYPFKQSYLDAISKHYGTATFPVDFRNDGQAARKRINAWVEERTPANASTNLIPESSAHQGHHSDCDQRRLLQGTMGHSFPTKGTEELPFVLADGMTVQVPTMRGKFKGNAIRYGAFNKDGTLFATPVEDDSGGKDAKGFYPDANGFEMLELPYKGNEISMVLIAPRLAEGLAAAREAIHCRRFSSMDREALAT